MAWRMRAIAARIAETEEYVAKVHDAIATGPSKLAGEAPAVANEARRFAEHERHVASGDPPEG